MTMTASEGLVAFLESIPWDMRPSYFEDLMTAAKSMTDAHHAGVLFTLLGPAGAYGSETPPTGKLKFPADHQLHLKMGTEWYWFSFNAAVDGSLGLDRIGGFATFKRVRSVSNCVQAQAGWTDVEAQIGAVTATVTLDTREHREILRRRPNVQWPMLGGNVQIGQPFLFGIGPDSLSGSADIMPLKIHIDDAPNMTVDVTMSPVLILPSLAFFQQEGKLTIPGVTGGFYYSWPQLAVEGTVTIGDRTYPIHGTGWVCHQMMMLLPAPKKPSQPGTFVPTDGVTGWSWCEFNLGNGDAFTCVAMQSGTVRNQLTVPYGWYLRRTLIGWEPIFLNGSLQLDRFVPGLDGVLIPGSWRYAAADILGGKIVASRRFRGIPTDRSTTSTCKSRARRQSTSRSSIMQRSIRRLEAVLC
jgi:predicted secreted hydrolase